MGGGVMALAAIAVESSYLQTMSRRGTGVFAWELVGNSARAHTVLARWGTAGRSAAETASWIDFAFIIGYTAVLVGLSRALGRRVRERRVSRGELLATASAGAALAAGAANALAKLVQMLILGWHTAEPLPVLGFAAAVLNYVLLTAAIIGCLALLVVSRRPR